MRREQLTIPRFLILILLPISYVTGQSPLDRGVYAVGGSFYYMAGKSDYTRRSTGYLSNSTSKERSFSFNPNVVYFIRPRLAVGLLINYGMRKETETMRVDDEINIYESYWSGSGPAIRYYLTEAKVMPFISAAFLSIKDSWSSNNTGSETEFREIKFTFGFDYLLARNVAIEPYIQYTIFSHISKDSFDFPGYAIRFTTERNATNYKAGVAVTLFIY